MTNFCAACGAQLRANAAFCPGCGTAVAPAGQVQAAGVKQGDSYLAVRPSSPVRAVVLLFAMGIAVVAVLTLAWAYITEVGPFAQAPLMEIVSLNEAGETEPELLFEATYGGTASVQEVKHAAQAHCAQFRIEPRREGLCAVFVSASGTRTVAGDVDAVAVAMAHRWFDGEILAIYYRELVERPQFPDGELLVVDCEVFDAADVGELGVCKGDARDLISPELAWLRERGVPQGPDAAEAEVER
jgi:hypothetical protein